MNERAESAMKVASLAGGAIGVALVIVGLRPPEEQRLVYEPQYEGYRGCYGRGPCDYFPELSRFDDLCVLAAFVHEWFTPPEKSRGCWADGSCSDEELDAFAQGLHDFDRVRVRAPIRYRAPIVPTTGLHY